MVDVHFELTGAGVGPCNADVTSGCCEHGSKRVIAVGTRGFIDKTGEYTLEISYPGIGTSFKEQMVQAKFSNKHAFWGFIDRMGIWVIEPKLYNVRPFSDGMAYVCFERKEDPEVGIVERWGFINRSGDLVLDCSDLTKGFVISTVATK